MKKAIMMIGLFLSFAIIQNANAQTPDPSCMGYENANTNSTMQQWFIGGSNWYNYPSGYCPNLNYGSSDVWGGNSKFVQNNSSMTTYYYGMRDQMAMTINGGRVQATWAQLDACFASGDSDTTNITDSSSCYNACDNSEVNVACQYNAMNKLGDCWNRCDGVIWNSPR